MNYSTKENFLKNKCNISFFLIYEIPIIFFIFLISRLFAFYYLQLGISSISFGYHLLDINLLKNDFLKSMLYLHSQPYMWNIFNGLLVKFFDGNITYISNFFLYYHFVLTIIAIYIIRKIILFFNLSFIKRIIIILFITINPALIFYENIFSYSHTTFCIFTILTYCILKYFKNYKLKYELYIYLLLFLLGSIWLLFQPILLLPASFVIFRFYTKFNKTSFYVFGFLFLLSIAPVIKNKIIFGVFVNSSKAGQDFGTVFYDWQNYCGHPIKDQQKNTEEYERLYKKTLIHNSLKGEMAQFNNLGMIVLGKKCFKITVNRILDSPNLYLIGRIKSFLASHGKFSFDYVHPTPKGWKKVYNPIANTYEKKNIKLIRQIIIFCFMMFLYFTLIKYFIFTKKKYLKNGIFYFGLIYFYLMFVSTMAAGTEQERCLYTGFVINVIFLIILLKNSCNMKNKKIVDVVDQ